MVSLKYQEQNIKNSTHNNLAIWPINQLFTLLSSISILLLALKLSADLVVPFLIAVAVSIILSPLFSYLEEKSVPKSATLLMVMIIVLIPVVILTKYIDLETKDLAMNYDALHLQFMQWVDNTIIILNKYGLSITSDEVNIILDRTDVSGIMKALFMQAKNQFSKILLIMFMVAFMLMESKSLYNKVAKITSVSDVSIQDNMQIIEKIKSYFLIKVKTSFITAILVLIVLWFYGVKYALLWATLAFFLNFIPVIGSILAAVPPVILAFIDQGALIGAWVGVWYVVINVLIGNILEPKIMGEGLGLSAMVIFLSMNFWGWMFGPAGMILSVPLTMVIQFLFSRYEETKAIALFLSDYK